jgi:hypothetical protein
MVQELFLSFLEPLQHQGLFASVCGETRTVKQRYILYCSKLKGLGGFDGLLVSMLASGTQVRESVGFFGRKNFQHAFLRRGIKAVCPMLQLCGMLKNPTVTWEPHC